MIHPWHDVTPGEDIPQEFSTIIAEKRHREPTGA